MKISELYGNMSESFAKELLSWYQKNKRDLPWRKSKDPYKIWLSEIILQQTRIDQGLPYYNKFIDSYPSIKHLAVAPRDEVMKLWQGLGYYSRCRNLHETAKVVWEEYQGEFPTNYVDLLKLKGIGPYTAAAIASICFKEPVAVVDGNVNRFISRYFQVVDAVNSTQGKKVIKNLVNELIDKNNPGDFNQAVMEFGATVCLPKNPNCGSCTFKNSCLAFANNQVHELPLKIKKRKPSPRYMNYFIVIFRDEVFIRKREAGDIWEGLFEPLLIEKDSMDTQIMMSDIIQGEYDLIGTEIELKHVLTHRIIYSRFQVLYINRKESLRSEGMWVKLEDLKKFPVPRLIDKYIENHLSQIVEYS